MEFSDVLSVSVIIPTKNRPDDLQLAVRSLFEQTRLAQQLIIVDQSESPESFQRIQKEYAELPAQVRNVLTLEYIRDSSIPGGAVARNRAMDVAQGQVLLFLDDDVRLEPDFVAELLAVYNRITAAGGVSGIITNYKRPRWLYRAWTALFLRGPFHDDRQPIYWRADAHRSHGPIAVTRLGGGLMSFRATAIDGLRFDENLRGVSDGEDVDFCMRLRPGTLLLVAPRARLLHNQSPRGRATDHFLRREARSFYYLYWRNWDRGIKNRLCFALLNLGFGLLATLAGLRRGSLEPWRALRAAIKDAKGVRRKQGRRP